METLIWVLYMGLVLIVLGRDCFGRGSDKMTEDKIAESRGDLFSQMKYTDKNRKSHDTWWLIPLSKWVTTLVINGISGGKSSTYNWGELTHLNDSWDEPPSIHAIFPYSSVFSHKGIGHSCVHVSEYVPESRSLGFSHRNQRPNGLWMDSIMDSPW